MLEGSWEAIARAFGRVEEEWLQFYQNHLLTGDDPSGQERRAEGETADPRRRGPGSAYYDHNPALFDS